MFKDDIKRSIGSVLKANGHKMVNLDGDTIFYVKRYSDELAFYVRCVHEKWKDQTTIEWFFTAIDTICDSIDRLSIGLRIPMITMVLENKDPLSGFPVVFATPETADNILIDIGKKIISLENSMGPLTEQMIMADLNNPYLCNKRDIVYREELQVYNVLNKDEELKECFTQFKINYNKVRKKSNESYKIFVSHIPFIT